MLAVRGRPGLGIDAKEWDVDRNEGWTSQPVHGAPVGRVLLLSSDLGWSDAIAGHLANEGFAVRISTASQAALPAALADGPYDLVIADAGDASSLTVLGASIRALTDDLLLVTGRTDADVIAATSGGADAYALRTTPPRVLTARVRALVRRYSGDHSRRGYRSDVQQIGDLTVTSSAVVDAVDDPDTLVLTPDSYAIVRMLLRRPGSVVGRTELLAELGLPSTGGAALDLAVRRLREQLERRIPARCIVAVRGVGYRFDGAAAAQAAGPAADATSSCVGAGGLG